MADTPASVSARTGWSVVAQTGAALAAAMGVGRFVFTPVLPLMEAQAHLLPSQASTLATSNYLGYLLGALLGVAVPSLSRTRLASRVSGVVLVASLAAMPLTHDLAAWVAIRGIAGLASAVVFMVAGNTILTRLAGARAHVVGWAYGGVGAGIAASGVLIAVIRSIGDWQAAWWSAAGLTALLLALGWSVGEPSAGRAPAPAATRTPDGPRHHRWFAVLAASYFLEGAGYIIAGTFLVAAVTASGPGWLSSSVWTLVGVAAVPSCAAWTWLSTRMSRPTLITGALVLQAVGIALPALTAAAPAAVVSALLFGATFVGITTLSLATGRHLRVPRAIAILTTGYGVGQVVGPQVVAPTLGSGYHTALLIGAGLVLLAGAGAALLRVRFPHHGEPHRHHRRPHATRPVQEATAAEAARAKAT
ncbi:Predicted arabinose efflux permease, MFS family [Actinacidiphila yanglinensis]|uniref:Predicted arabinose efflux permease, MFS family n=1 Tax=Actinacidiphila yanglinensis TaxID=310779 RepID=A0A1H5XGE8_9ACTN|nr:YbfB/YjiJ family MFS transporter [Actinacidiphila yanglinensis]SEG10703.1 Predicted arabinose efflux permease, MFS family [Actinacidiphila yanglinensis]